MLEKGFCEKNAYGAPEAYLHVSNQIQYKDGKTFGEIITGWKIDITDFYVKLCDSRDELRIGMDADELLEKLEKIVSKKEIDITRKDYNGLLKETKEACVEKDRVKAIQKLDELLKGLQKKIMFIILLSALKDVLSVMEKKYRSRKSF